MRERQYCDHEQLAKDIAQRIARAIARNHYVLLAIYKKTPKGETFLGLQFYGPASDVPPMHVEVRQCITIWVAHATAPNNHGIVAQVFPITVSQKDLVHSDTWTRQRENIYARNEGN